MYILKSTNEAAFDLLSLGFANLEEISTKLHDTVVCLPIKYDLEKLDLENLYRLKDEINKEIQRQEMFGKLKGEV